MFSRTVVEDEQLLSLTFARRRVLSTLVTILAARTIAEPAPLPAQRVSATDQLDCTATTNETERLRALIERGGTAAGRTLFIPSGCKILLGSPGAGDSVADVASNTTIECEDSTAGFVLARKSCSDSSETPGAACTADIQCKSGTCDPDYPAGDSFAPTSGSTYTVFGAAAGTTDVAIKRCGIWTNQGSGDSTAMGGAGKRWGYCDGSGRSDVTGEGCYDACDSSSGAFKGTACIANTDCNTGGASTPGSCMAVAGGCKAGGGVCGSIPYGTAWGASGAGKIHPLAWGSATGARIEDVVVYDHRIGDATIAAGAKGVVLRSSTIGNTLEGAQQSASVFGSTCWLVGTGRLLGAAPGCVTATVAEGIVAGAGTDVVNSTGYGWSVGIHAMGYNHVTASKGGGYGDPSQSGWNGNTDLLISNAGVIATGFVGGGSLYCVLPEFAKGFNFLVSNAYCDSNLGAKFIIQNAGNQYLGVRGAWHGRGAVIGLGDQRGRCSRGSRTGLVCVFGANSDAKIGCPGGACEAHADFRAGSSNHFVVGGGSLLQSQLGADVAFFRATDSRRCTAASTSAYGAPCKTDADCPGGSCDYLTWTNGLIDGVLFYNGASATAFDLATSGVGVNRTDGPSIGNWLVSGVELQGFATGFAFPPLTRSCTGGLGGANDNGTACSVDSACRSTCRGGTGSGLACSTSRDCPGGSCAGTPRCMGPIHDFTVIGTADGVTTPLANWDWSYGDVSGLKGLTANDDQPTIVRLVASEGLSRGQMVSVSDSMDRAVARTTTSARERAIGVALADTESGQLAKIQTSGVGRCVASAAGVIERGARLTPSTTTAGTVASSVDEDDPIVATALEPAAANATFRCLVRVR